MLPVANEICPVGHVVHAAPPGSVLNEPAGQAAQDAGRPVKPALHWQVPVPGINAAFRRHGKKQSVLAVAPAIEFCPVGQFVQTPAFMKLPPGHLHDVIDVLAFNDAEPSGQGLHTRSEIDL